MKLCKDCKHYQTATPGMLDHSYSKCLAPENMVVISPVTGELRPHMTYCEENRNDANLCGCDAVWFDTEEEIDADEPDQEGRTALDDMMDDPRRGLAEIVNRTLCK